MPGPSYVNPPTDAEGPWEKIVRTHYEVRTSDDGVIFSTNDREIRKEDALGKAQDWVANRHCTSGPFRIVEVVETWWTSSSVFSDPVEVVTPPGRHDLVGVKDDPIVFCIRQGCTHSEPA